MPDFSGIGLSTYLLNCNGSNNSGFLEQFRNKPEFEIMAPEDDEVYFANLNDCVLHGMANCEDFIVVCRADGWFTGNYLRDRLISQIIVANHKGCDILFGGLTGLVNVVPVTSELSWIDKLSCSTFMVIYSKFFRSLTNMNNSEELDFEAISSCSSNKLTIFPFINVASEGVYNHHSVHDSRSTEIGHLAKSFNRDEDTIAKILAVKRNFPNKQVGDLR